MADKVTVNNSGGIGVVGLLGVLFIALKLTGTITWSWLWVLAPFWGGIAIAMVLGVIALIIVLIVGE